MIQRTLSLVLLIVSISFSSAQKYVSDAELKEWSESLFSKDENNIAKFISLQIQGHSKPNSTVDYAPLPLLIVDHNGLKGPTVSKLPSLYNNFIPDTTQDEVVTLEETKEQNAFLDAVLNTTVMSLAHELLKSKDFVSGNKNAFKEFMYNLWFKLYSRGKHKLSSSAFEHVFLGELKNGQISGFHNWLYYYFLESKKLVNYLGWLRKVDFNDKKGHLLKLHFTWGEFTKPVSSIFIGTSPELEMALYTMCFLARPNNKCHVSFSRKNFYVQTFSFSQNGQKLISSAYPNL